MEDKNDVKNYKKYYDPKFKPDLVHEQRLRVLNNFHKRYAPHMLSYYYSKKLKIKETSIDIYNKIEELLNDPKTDIREISRVSETIWLDYWHNIEMDGFRKDEFGMLKKRKDYEKIIEEYKHKMNTFSYNMLFKFQKYLFSDGAVNIILGGMGSGKSNLALVMALDTMASGNYELVTNLGIDEKALKKYNDIHYVTSFKEVLLIVCKNQLNNFEYENKGEYHKVKNMICIIDEGEQLFQAGDDHGKEIKNFNLLAQFFRKLNMSCTLIYHRWGDVPKKIRDSASLNCKIFKNLNVEGEPIDLGLDKAILEFPKYRKTIILEDIKPTKILISKFQSVFILEDFDNFPEKSVNMKYILRLGLDSDLENLPKRIIDELEKEKVEYFAEEKLISCIEKIERINRDYKVFCENKTEYFEYVKSCFETEFRISNIESIKGLSEKIKSTVYRNWVLDSINEKRKKEDISAIEYLSCDFNVLYLMLKNKKTKEVRDIVNQNKRVFDDNEYKELLRLKISEQKLRYVYGESKDTLQKIKVLKSR